MTKIALILTIIIIFANAFLALIVFLRNKSNRNNQHYLLLAVSFEIWIIGLLFSQIYQIDRITAVFALRTTFFGAFLIPISFYAFFISFYEQRNLLKIYLILTPLFMGLSFSNKIVEDSSLSFPYEPIFGALYYIFASYFLIGVSTAFVKLLQIYYKANKLKKLQLKFILAGTIFSIIFGATTNLILPLLGINQWGFLGPLAVLIFLSFTAYAIIKHRLMDIRLLVLKSVAYSLSFGTIVLGYVSITTITFKRLEVIIHPIALNIFMLFILLFSFDPLRKFIEKHTNKLFAKNRYSPETLWRMLDEINISFSRQEDLTRRWLQTITEQMNISKAAFLLLGSPVKFIQNMHFPEIQKSDWQLLADIVLEHNATVVYDELSEDLPERQVIREYHSEILIPIKKKNKILGILVLGEKNSGDIYSAQDISFLEDFANRAAVALERSKEIKAKEREIFKIKALYNQAEKSVSSVSLDHVLNATIDTAFMATDSDGGSIMLIDKTGDLLIKASRGIANEFGARSIPVGEGIAGRVALTRRPLIVDDRDPELARLLKREQIQSAMCVPMEVGGKLVGILSVNRIYSKERFTSQDLALVCTVAANIAHRIENTKLIQEERKLHKEVINIYAAATEARDPYTFGHSETVTLYAGAIARALSLSNSHVRIIENAAILHDIGKIGIPDHILNKPGKLTNEEYQNIRQHPIIGERLIRQYSNLDDVAPLALHHHERYDGHGYPDQIKNKGIPLGARILAAADAFDAMTSDRPYKPAQSLGQSRKELVRNAGTQFDPKIAEVFLELLTPEFFKEVQEKKNISKLTRLHH